MLTITLKSEEEFWSREFHVGAGRLMMNETFMNDVFSVQADGHELDRLVSTVTGLPRSIGNRVETWYGDHAKFIVGNLKL